MTERHPDPLLRLLKTSDAANRQALGLLYEDYLAALEAWERGPP